MLAPVLVPHYSKADAVSALELTFIDVAVEELPDALGETRAVKVPIIDLPISSRIYPYSMSLMSIPHPIKHGPRPITYLTHSIHYVIIEPPNLHLRVQQPPATPLLILGAPQHLSLVVLEVEINHVAVVSLVGPVIAIEIGLGIELGWVDRTEIPGGVEFD